MYVWLSATQIVGQLSSICVYFYVNDSGQLGVKSLWGAHNCEAARDMVHSLQWDGDCFRRAAHARRRAALSIRRSYLVSMCVSRLDLVVGGDEIRSAALSKQNL